MPCRVRGRSILVVFVVSCGGASEGPRRDSTPVASTAGSAGTESLFVVGATDYAFVDIPDTVAAGTARFVLRNMGRNRHELALARLQPGVTLAQAFAVARVEGGDGSQVIDQELGLIVADPGLTSTDTLRVELVAGRTYGLVCFLRDAPGHPEHVSLGMFKGFVVR